MASTAAERAEAYRARQQDKLARYSRMEAALTAIVEVVTPRQDKPVSQQILAIAQEGLKL